MNFFGEKVPPVLPGARVPSPEQTLRRLFLTLFLRGRSSRGLQKEKAPKSVGEKLALTLIFYALFGFFALFFLRQPIFGLSIYLHAMTFVFLGMFVASSAGEILFNKEEADILLHRPITPRALLWAKIRVLVEVSLWLAFAFNLAGLFVGLRAGNGGIFILAHLISTTLMALFCTGCVVMVYQLCLRWFGRERLEGLMTLAQVFISIAAVVSGHILPRLMLRFDNVIQFSAETWWIALLPPAWFAGFDDALAGTMAAGSWVFAALAVVATVTVLWLAFGKLARDYETGLQTLNETISRRTNKSKGRRWIGSLVSVPPLCWWLRNPVERASFLLTAAYLIRDRDVKLRVYPALAPMLALPFIFLFQSRDVSTASFGIAFSGSYLGLIPVLGLSLLQYSQQWQASDVFRAAPLPGPMALCHGARRAVLVFLTLPILILFGLIVCVMTDGDSRLLALIPGVIALPVFALFPSVRGMTPLSLPTDEAKSAGRGMTMIGMMLVAMALAGITVWSLLGGWFWWLVMIETIVVIVLYALLRFSSAPARWPSLE